MFYMGHKTLSHERCHQYFNLIFMYITKTDNRIEKNKIVGNLHNIFALVMGPSVTGAERTRWRGGEASGMQAPEIQSEPEERDKDRDESCLRYYLHA